MDRPSFVPCIKGTENPDIKTQATQTISFLTYQQLHLPLLSGEVKEKCRSTLLNPDRMRSNRLLLLQSFSIFQEKKDKQKED